MRRWTFVAILAAGFAISAIWSGRPAEARDRPGTPNMEGFFGCGYTRDTYAPILCGQFNNTATEEVRIEIEETKNGAPFAMDTSKFNCSNLPQQAVKHWDGSITYIPHAICYTLGRTYQRKSTDPAIAYVFETGGVDWNAQYCVRFRARRVGDDVVSQQWSNYACATVPPAPSAPSRPDFNVTFSGSQSYTPGNAAPGQVGRIVPAVIQVAPASPSQRPNLTQLKVGGRTESWSYEPKPEQLSFSIPPGDPTLAVEMCAYNFSGHACRVKTLDILAQTVVPVGAPGYRIPVAAGPAPASSAIAGIVRLPHLNSGVMAGIDLPGNDYRNQPIDGTAVDCETMCTGDGMCKAWAWVKAGVQNAKAMCWLKNAVPATRPSNPNVTSGIKAAPSVR